MEAATVPTDTPAARDTAQQFRYAAWVHEGPGADECEHREDGACSDVEHFHAYVRLPNQFQHSDIRQKAMAARARRMRQLRDPETDSYAILEAELEELHRVGDRLTLVEELVRKDWWKRHLEAARDVEEREEFEHVAQDRERLAEIERMDPDDRPQEEDEELRRHLAAFGEAVEARRNELEEPLREALNERDMNELVDLVREDRIAADAQAAFMETYSKWQMFAGTLRPSSEHRPKVRVFDDITELESAEPEVVEALRMQFANLEAVLASGNS